MAKDIAQEITERVIQALEEGTVPWHKPWNVGGLMPTSLQTGKPYQGINAFWLGFMAQAYGYERNLWVTYKQAQALGGNVKKGQHSTEVVYWSKVTGKPKEGEELGRQFMLMRYYAVFNVEQCENLTVPDTFAPQEPVTISEALRQVRDNYGVEVQHQNVDQAYYSPSLDIIVIPPMNAFSREMDYAETLLHEMTHSTGHERRLNRFTEKDQPRHFGSEVYAREELVAELGASMLCGRLGVESDFTNTVAYIQSWLKALKDDKNLIIQAAQRAGKAVEYILGTTQDALEEGENNVA